MEFLQNIPGCLGLLMINQQSMDLWGRGSLEKCHINYMYYPSVKWKCCMNPRVICM